MRVVGQLTVEDLLAVPADEAVVIVDAAAGISPGLVVDLPMNALRRLRGCRPRSSHAIEAREVIGLADVPPWCVPDGRIVAIGGDRFELGSALGPRVPRRSRISSPPSLMRSRSSEGLTMCIDDPGRVVAIDSLGAIVETAARRRRASTLFLPGRRGRRLGDRRRRHASSTA